jgi:hypothetical protein
MAVFHKIVKLVKNGVLMVIHIYAKVSPSLKPIKTTSFLTPPFGFSLFYLKGVAPKSIQTTDIYKGVIPFIIIQVSVLVSLIVFPQWYGFSGF